MTSHVRDTFAEMLSEQWQYRELLVRITQRDLLLRYKQTAMGFLWALLMPIVNTIVFSVIFMRVAPLDTGMPYPLYAFSGLLAWNFFASSLRFAVNSLTSNAVLVSKVYFPREILPLSCVLVSAVDSVVAGLALAGMMFYYGVGISVTLLALPVVMGVHLAITTAAALVISMANLFYRDVKYLFEIALTVWMFITSVVYPVERAGGLLAAVMRWNPMTPVIDAYRDTLIRHQWPSADFLVVAVFSIGALLVAWLTFHEAEFRFAEDV